MSLDFSRPYHPGDRVVHPASGYYGTVRSCEWSPQFRAYLCQVAFDAFLGREYKMRADTLECAPKHVPFACITSPLRAPSFPGAQKPGRSDPPSRPGMPFPPDCA